MGKPSGADASDKSVSNSRLRESSSRHATEFNWVESPDSFCDFVHLTPVESIVCERFETVGSLMFLRRFVEAHIPSEIVRRRGRTIIEQLRQHDSTPQRSERRDLRDPDKIRGTLSKSQPGAKESSAAITASPPTSMLGGDPSPDYERVHTLTPNRPDSVDVAPRICFPRCRTKVQPARLHL